jgi:regulator of protease activity HflC (stomatin/prohibitin superfamily)
MLPTLIAVVGFVILISGIRIAREYQRAVVFRLGRYTGLRGPGLFWLIPLGVENETRVDLRIVTNPIEQQETTTRDSVTADNASQRDWPARSRRNIEGAGQDQRSVAQDRI